MENEGQLRTPGLDPSSSPGAIRRLSHSARGGGSNELDLPESQTYDSILSAESRTGLVERNLFLRGSAVQSPAIDSHMNNDPFDAAFPTSHDFTYDSDSSSTHTATRSSQALPQPKVQQPRLPSLTVMQKNILKCAVAYFLGSLFTFNPYLSGIVSDITSAEGPSPSGHMVATVAVYFNPAKTAGGMVEADTYCFMGLLFAAVVSLCSMESFWWFEVQPGWEWLADTLVVLWVGVAVSLVAWMKLWMAKPTFNPACSMIAIIIFTVVVKEGGVGTLAQTAVIVSFGITIANLVCYTIWPQSATQALRANMQKTLDSFGTLLTMITSTFLLEDIERGQLSEDDIQKAVASHQNSFTSLKKSLDEAHSEAIFGGPSTPNRKGGRKSLGQAYEDAVDSLNRLGQHLNGLRGGTRLQLELSKAHAEGKLNLHNRGVKAQNGKGLQELGQNAILQATADMFGELVDDSGPPLNALSSACKDALYHLRLALDKTKGKKFNPTEFNELADKLERALFTFESTSNQAFMRLYRKSLHSEDLGDQESRASIVSIEDGRSVLSVTEYENLFLVYFFIFTLQEFARELESLIDALGRVCAIEYSARVRGSWWKRNIAKVWNSLKARVTTQDEVHHPQPRQNTMKRPISTYFLPKNKFNQGSWFPKVQPHAPNTVQTPARKDLSWWGRVGQMLWAFGSLLKRHDIKFAFKAGMATALLAAPAFVERTRWWFVEYRGEWALISFFVVISPTIGATNSLSVHRIAGTLLGAFTAAGIYTLFPDNAIALSIFGFFFSLPCFYYIVARPTYATSGRFVLLAYNLTCLYCYNLRSTDIDVIDIALKRSISVTVGVVYAFVVSRVWWPSEARRELGIALGEFCSNVAWLYMRLVSHNSFAAESVDFGGVDDEYDGESMPEEGSLLGQRTPNQSGRKLHLRGSIEEFMAMELHLQIKLIELQGLLAQTIHEPRLKGPFPVNLYRSILTSLQTILDQLHSMRCVTTREEWYTNVRREFILPVNKPRRDMVGNIILYFSILSSAFRLKAPLPPYLPPAESARQRLVDSILELDVVKRRDVHGSKQLLFFAYVMTMKSVTQELEALGKTVQEAFGVIGQTSEEFDALFSPAGPLV